jgi:hypothetical protein
VAVSKYTVVGDALNYFERLGAKKSRLVGRRDTLRLFHPEERRTLGLAI